MDWANVQTSELLNSLREVGMAAAIFCAAQTALGQTKTPVLRRGA